MASNEYHVASEDEAVQLLRVSRGRFVPWIGAGVSAEAQMPTAKSICEVLTEREWLRLKGLSNSAKLTSDQKAELDDFRENRFQWTSSSSDLYSRLLEFFYPTPATRNDYFRDISSSKQPSFAHCAAALLMREKFFAPICFTTNFDKLIEKAFVKIGEAECQPIRNVHEHQYIDDKAGQYFCIKLHGDYDTLNTQNTPAELRQIERKRAQDVRERLSARGLLVLGLAGHDQSVLRLLEESIFASSNDERLLEYGILWGVYVGRHRPESGDKQKAESAVREAVNSGSGVGIGIRRLMKDAGRRFSFFPVYGAGEFLLKVIQDNADLSQAGTSIMPMLDPEMRLASRLREVKVPSFVIDHHLAKLQDQKKKVSSTSPTPGGQWSDVFARIGCARELKICYGNLGDAQLLESGVLATKLAIEKGRVRSAVLTPDDTCVSIGGGASLAVASASGVYSQILHDVHKLTPTKPGDVIVTTAGVLPVDYIFHGAGLEIKGDITSSDPEDYFIASLENIDATVENALLNCYAQKIDLLFVPLISAGRAGIKEADSAHAMLSAIKKFVVPDFSLDIVFVVFSPKQLTVERFSDLATEVRGHS